MKSIVIFASGSGTNAENIILHFKRNAIARVSAVFCNRADAAVVDKAKSHGIPVVIFSGSELKERDVHSKLEGFKPDLIVLAGFLLKFPSEIINKFPHKIINIHPALLPLYGGHGMYGMNVHRKVLENQDPLSGISVHYVDEHYDKGALICQKTISLENCNTAEDIAAKVQSLEHEFFPTIIEELLNKDHGIINE